MRAPVMNTFFFSTEPTLLSLAGAVIPNPNKHSSKTNDAKTLDFPGAMYVKVHASSVA